MAMTTPGGAFFAITRKKIAPIAKFAFHGMAGERAAANRAGNGGNRPATHTTDASPQPAFSPIGQGCLNFGAEIQSAGNKSPAVPGARFLRVGGVAGRGRVRFSEKPLEKSFSETALTSLDCISD